MSDSNPVLISGIIGGIALVATAVTIGYSIRTNAEEEADTLRVAEEAAKKKAEEEALRVAKKKVKNAKAEALRQIQEGNNSVPQFNIRSMFSIFNNSNQNEPKSPNSNKLIQLSQPYTGTYECTRCNSTFNNPTDYYRHLIKESENNHKRNQEIENLDKRKPLIKQQLFHPMQHHLTDRGANPLVQNERPLLERKGGIRKRKRTHKKHRRLHNRSHTR
jgi:hypothetical protein